MNKTLIRLFLGTGITIAGLFLIFMVYKSRSELFPVEAKVFRAPIAKYNSWDQVFKNPGPVEVKTIYTGEVSVKKSGLLNLNHPNAKGLKDINMKLGVFSHLVYHEMYGYYLIDAGLDASVQKNQYGNQKGFLVKKMSLGYSQRKGMDMGTRLKERGIQPQGIFLTHLHYDHTSGLSGLSKDIGCYMGKGETYLNYKFIYESDNLKGFRIFIQFDFSKAPIMEPIGPALDIFGDGSIWAVSTPGHTKGHVSYLINGKEGPVLITGDACSVKYGLESGIGPGTFSTDGKLAQFASDKILKFHRMYPQVKIIFGHELP